MADGPTFYHGDAKPTQAQAPKPIVIPPENPMHVGVAETFERKAREAMPADAAAMKLRAEMMQQLYATELLGWILGILFFFGSSSPYGTASAVFACFWWAIAYGSRLLRSYTLWLDAKLSPDKCYAYTGKDPIKVIIILLCVGAAIFFLIFAYSSTGR